MKLILLEGGPASGKTTLGEKLVERFQAQGENSVLLDHDTYVEELCPDWTWPDEALKENDLARARAGHLKDINRYLAKNFVVVATGGLWLTAQDVSEYTSRLEVKTPVYLFHLDAPLDVRKQRLVRRGPAPRVNLDKDQEVRDAITSRPGHVYRNTAAPEREAANLMRLISAGAGLIFP